MNEKKNLTTKEKFALALQNQKKNNIILGKVPCAPHNVRFPGMEMSIGSDVIKMGTTNKNKKHEN